MTKVKQNFVLKQMQLSNFKGVADFKANFNQTTNIWGDNATGKTSVFDAFLWLFFGKNSEDVAQFEVKRLDANNNFIKNLDAEVTATFEVNGVEIVAKKVLRQKWTKRRGSVETEYSGDENNYFWNDVPMKESEFKEKIKGFFDENVFRLVTNPFYFNSIKWQDRRNILIDLAGQISNDAIIEDCGVNSNNKIQFDSLILALNQGKSLDEFKRELAAKKKKVKDEAEMIPSRIDEAKRSAISDYDFTQVTTDLKVAEASLNKTNQMLLDKQNSIGLVQQNQNEAIAAYNKQVADRNNRILALNQTKSRIEFEAKSYAANANSAINSKVSLLQNSIDEKTKSLNTYRESIRGFEQTITESEAYINSLREKYIATDGHKLEFNDTEFVCPTCKQLLPETDKAAKQQELANNFNSKKASELTTIAHDANKSKEQISLLNERIQNGKKAYSDLEHEINSLNIELNSLNEQKGLQKSEEDLKNDFLSSNAEYATACQDLTFVETTKIEQPTFNQVGEDAEIQTLRTQAKMFSDKVVEYKSILAKQEFITKANERVDELTKQETTLAQQLAEFEGIEYAVMQFTKAKVDTIEKRINGKFKFVKFKLFNQQVNGGETECCDTLVNSNGSFVPFSDANNAAKINAGIDIINTLCEHYGISAPIFIDNRESVTTLIPSTSQIVNLIVSEADKKLRVA